MASYTYDPEKISEAGRDRMRFELGDVMVEGGADTCALSDEEYDAVLGRYPDRWRRAKLALIESVLRRFSYEVDTRVGPLSLSLSQRLDAWRTLYQDLKEELTQTGSFGISPSILEGRPYFFEGMHDNLDAGGAEGRRRRVLP